MRKIFLASILLAGVVAYATTVDASCPYCTFDTALCLGTEGGTLCTSCVQLNPGCFCYGGECNPDLSMNTRTMTPDGSLDAPLAETVGTRVAVGDDGVARDVATCQNWVVARHYDAAAGNARRAETRSITI